LTEEQSYRFFLAEDFFDEDFRFAVDFLPVDFFAEDFFDEDFRFAVDFFAVDFFLPVDFLAEDFFLAGIVHLLPQRFRTPCV
jgi:hypothetical protein